jgi:Na+-transporting NADH:ubiquinone oxidoreductase subunit A
VKEGDSVKAGTPIMFDKYAEDVMFASPVSGEVVEINRGEKRKLLEIKILADKNIVYEDFGKVSSSDIASMTRDDVVREMSRRGVWTQLIQRPFGVVADTLATPKSIFISGFDTHPLAPDMDFILKGEEQNLQLDLMLLRS